jgi:signal transduction histidine kinase
MKLINKFTIWYFTVTTLVLLIGGFLVFYLAEKEIREEEERRLITLMEDAVNQIKINKQQIQVNASKFEIKELDIHHQHLDFKITMTAMRYSEELVSEPALTASKSYYINGKHYFISITNFIIPQDEISDSVIQSLSWIFVILIILFVLASRIISNWILLPFHKALKVIKSFNIKQKEKVQLPDVKTYEFNELNHFLEKMTNKALNDYQSLKEFTENASHEMQTPLAVVRGKLELLMEMEINDEQAKHILVAHNAIEKLSKTNQSLALLAKLENWEYQQQQPIDFTALIHEKILSLEELIKIKSILLECDLNEKIQINLNPDLADILLNNLLSNAIRHNFENGKIYISLTSSKFIIKNTGNPPEIPTVQLFERFKKGIQSSDSIGLGLAIIKQICDLNNFTIEYTYQNNFHTIEIIFH